MVCCALLSMFIAVAIWFVSRVMPRPTLVDRDPLAWRPHGRPPIEEPEPARPAGFTLTARLKSFFSAIEGLRFMLRYEHNAWIHFAATIGIVAAGLAIGISGADWRWIVAAILWVWFAEAMNTAFEHLCDAVRPGLHESVRIAKDVAAGGVLVSAIGAAILGVITLAPYIAPLAADLGVDLTLYRNAP